jgi:hypothetical protein
MRDRLSYANVVATLALVVAVGTGGAWAASRISGSLLQDRSVAGKKLKKNKVTGKEVRESTLKGLTHGGGTVLSGHTTASAGGPPGPSDTVKSIGTPLGDLALNCTADAADARYSNTKPGSADVFRAFQATGSGVGLNGVDHDVVATGANVGYAATNSTGPIFLDMRAGKGQSSILLRVGERRSGTACVWDWEFVGSG